MQREIELFHEALDGTAVLHHDDTLDRCSDGKGPLARLSAADLAGTLSVHLLPGLQAPTMT